MAAKAKEKSKRDAALEAAGDVGKGHTRHLRVSTAEKGESARFWRAGVKHTSSPVDHPMDSFDADQQTALFDEPRLKVEIVDVKDEKAEK